MFELCGARGTFGDASACQLLFRCFFCMAAYTKRFRSGGFDYCDVTFLRLFGGCENEL